MAEFITQIYTKVLSISDQSPVIAGIISLWGLTVLTFLLKIIPKSIFNIIKKQITVTLEFDNTQGYDHLAVYNTCMDWFYRNNKKISFSRTFSLYTVGGYDYSEDVYKTKTYLGPGYGTHLFFLHRRLLWLTLKKIESSGSELQKRSVSISTFGRKTEVFEKFLSEFSPEDKSKSLYIMSYDTKKGWDKDTVLRKREMDSIAMSNDLKNKFIRDINHFNTQEDWFISKGLPYKLTYILHGIPGTGKTSWIKALASYFNKNVCIINISSCTDQGFQKALSSVPENSIVLIEDFDSSSAVKNRVVKIEDKQDSNVFECLTLTGILNGLDGINSLHNTIIFLTTNHLEKVDAAVYREGRVDDIIEFKEAPAVEVERFSKKMFPDEDFINILFKPTLGCKISNALLVSKGEFKLYIDKLKEVWEEGG